MSLDRDAQVRQIVLAVGGLDPIARQQRLDDLCGHDAGLRADVEHALAEHDMNSRLDLPTATLHDGRAKPKPPPVESSKRESRPAPSQIGPYTILQRIGEGGMGVVYEAEQDHPRRIVALKVIRPAYATPRMLRRFEFEVQVLGQLEHSGIARIYEAGTAEEHGSRFPFFAMEFIQGDPITTYAQTHGLGTRERLELVARACDAVHHAHLKGVIHRDLKPANILVQPPGDGSATGGSATNADWGVGQPKVLDFGVARAIDHEIAQQTQHTEAGQMVGTLPYMSPEQIAGQVDSIDVRADVYSLGVVLYETLTTRLPYDLFKRSLVDAARMIREQEPMRPSASDPSLRGDVDTIVLKALAKDPRKRYESAAQLAADIRRHLRDEPITARPASAMYQLQKLARRHKAVFVGMAIAVLGLIAGTVFATRQAILANRAAKDAMQQRDRARDAEDAALFEGNRARRAEIEANTQRDFAKQQAMLAESAAKDAMEQRDRARDAENAALFEGERARKAEIEANTQRDFAMGAKRQADAVNQFLRDMLSSVDPERTPDHEITMVEVLDSAAGTIGDRFKDDPLVDIAVRETIGNTYQSLGKFDRAAEQMRLVLERARSHFGDDNATTHNARTNLALAYRDLDRHTEALALAKEAADGLMRTLGPDAASTLSAKANLAIILGDAAEYAQARDLLIEVVQRRRDLGDDDSQAFLRNLSALSSMYNDLGQYDLAEPLAQEALDKCLATLGPSHPDVITSKNNLARLYLERGDLARARQMLEELIATAPAVLGPNHPMTFTMMSNLGGIYSTLGMPEKAQPLFEQELAFCRRTLGDKHRDTLSAMGNLAGAYEAQKRIDLAGPMYVEVLKGRRETLGDDHPDTIASINNLGFFYRNTRQYQLAEPLLTEALQRFTAAFGEKHSSTLFSMSSLGAMYNEMGLYSEAEPYNRKVLSIAGEIMPEGHWFRGVAQVREGASLAGVKRYDEAEPMLLSGRESLSKTLGEQHERTKLATRELVKLYEAWNKPDEAAKWQAKLPPER